jgi:urea transport system substrate-binding protein
VTSTPGSVTRLSAMRRWLLGGFVLLAALVAIDFVVGQIRGTWPVVAGAVRGVIAEAQAPIVVGLIHSETGPLAISEKSLLEAEILAVDEINARGGIAGRRVKWVKADGRSDPSAFASQALRLIEQDKADVVIGGWTAESRKAMLDVVEKKDGLLIFPANFEGIERSAHAIYVGGSVNQVVLPAVRWSFDALKARKFFVIGTEEVWSRVASEIAKDGIKAAGGELAGESYLPLVGGDLPGLVEQIRAAKPDIVLNAMVGDSNVAFYAALRRSGSTPEALPVVAFAVAEDELRRFSPGDVAGHYAAFGYYQGLDRPENLDFVRKFKAKYGDSRAISDTMVSAYNGLMIWAQAAEEAGTGDPKAVNGRFDRQSIDAPEGIVTIDPDSRIAWRPFCLGKARADGQFDLAWSIGKPIQPITFPATRSRSQWRSLLEGLKVRWGGRWSTSEPVHPSPTPPVK